ncbi:hypothetical protein SDC9_167510 [bioreactor metagenome]|uniref:Uncharacterized protein n=1 Tax=bioreactor metagenome TaxID=1076179 RepID=A0A645G883_9ZZZZ
MDIPGDKGHADNDHRPKTVVDSGESHVKQGYLAGWADIGIAEFLGKAGRLLLAPLSHRFAFPASA